LSTLPAASPSTTIVRLMIASSARIVAQCEKKAGRSVRSSPVKATIRAAIGSS